MEYLSSYVEDNVIFICGSPRWKTNVIPSCVSIDRSIVSLHLKLDISELPLTHCAPRATLLAFT